MFLNPSESVDRPCKDVLAHPVQCFQEMFYATPAVVGTFFLGIGGFALAVVIWGTIFAAAILAFYYVLKQIFRGLKYFFYQTKVGRKISSLIPFKRYLQRLCCKAQEVQPKKLINTQAIGEYGSNIVSKVNVDSKLFRNVFKHVPFARSSGDNNDSSSNRSPSKTPQRSTYRLSGLTPKILSPKSHKQ